MGEYILLNKNQGDKARHVLFPCPHPVYGKGCLVQSTLWGTLILGPTARDTMVKNKATGKYEPDPDVINEPTDNIMGYVLAKSRALVPDFDAGQVIHTFAGTRAKNTTGDWIIGPVEGVPGFINAASIDSPGIAASPAIAADIVRMLSDAGAPVGTPDPTFNPIRAPLIVPKSGYKGLKMSKSEFFKEGRDPKSNVICKCERVTEQEVIDACRRSLPVDSTQAIRKRTRAGMGHCQADPDNYDCETRVAMIIARETGLPLDQVGRRPWPGSSMMTKRVLDSNDSEHLRKLSDPSTEYTLHGGAA
jgi:glycerol-3-phosphate dehydrogenase